jgi:hypothetical protein
MVVECRGMGRVIRRLLGVSLARLLLRAWALQSLRRRIGRPCLLDGRRLFLGIRSTLGDWLGKLSEKK